MLIRGKARKFLNAIDEKPDAKLISIDIEDCSNSVKSDRWEFVQQDSSDIDSFLLKTHNKKWY